MRKARLFLATLAVALAAGSVFPVAADVKAPGVCKKQGPSDCSGNSECSGPHYSILNVGQKKKC
jgi:hypothetical protein